jgi:hypothetical protein
VPAEHDSRWENNFTYTREDGIVVPVSSFEALEAIASEWAGFVDPAVPPGIAELLATSRALVAHGWFKFEFLAVPCLVAAQAVEAACRQVIHPNDRAVFQQLLTRAVKERQMPPPLALRVETKPGKPYAVPELRNWLAHPGGQLGFPPAAAGPILAASHKIMTHLCLSVSRSSST